ncbi:hypothetical protein DUF1312 [Gottschalkia acidurici 9a]|uniref:Uncharacterized protein n=1 Tax=Gottschalkia acidurici (strain ATCC 7906 / DSM 604 / BCRC 14475 / CIP 104303 / KCTC 5404 / NCIMB 10678 / 9a) TaxID=1128398 RepID=K0AYZ9_GOTA9|nr:NusG domain II-containing protein [Gottschalkia acidurici]AFS78017.1 hypothetical protein DUF1312 [Gottschalkia acidurici 9a]
MTKWDKYLAALIILLSLSSMIYIKNIATNKGNKYAVIEVDGKEYKKITFSNDNEKKHLEIKTQYGYNKVEIQGEKVRVIDADCPDKLDVKQGWISSVDEVIVCLPNRLVIEIRGEKNSQDEIDSISY